MFSYIINVDNSQAIGSGIYVTVDNFMFSGSSNLMDTLEDLPPGIGQYEDFHTIDWLRDVARDRMRHRQVTKKKQDGCLEYLKGLHDAWSGWMCVLLVGIAAGELFF